MIMGIGVDMVSEARVARSIKRPGFLEKVYGPAERALLKGRGMRPQTAAASAILGRIAVPEEVE